MEKKFIDRRVDARVGLGVRAEAISLALVLAVIVAASIVLPLALKGHNGFLSQNSQFFAGPAVNCALIIAGIKFRKLSTACVIFAPSVFALTGGLFLAIGNVFALYMIPAIWLGNLALVLGFRYLYKNKKMNFVVTSAIAIAVKVAIIFAGYNLLVAVGLIPAGSPAAQALFLMMGLYQLYTAAAGAILARGILYLNFNKIQNKA